MIVEADEAYPIWLKGIGGGSGGSSTLDDDLNAELDVPRVVVQLVMLTLDLTITGLVRRIHGLRFLHLLRRLGRQLSHLLFARAHWQLEQVPDLMQQQHTIPEVHW